MLQTVPPLRSDHDVPANQETHRPGQRAVCRTDEARMDAMIVFDISHLEVYRMKKTGGLLRYVHDPVTAALGSSF